MTTHMPTSLPQEQAAITNMASVVRIQVFSIMHSMNELQEMTFLDGRQNNFYNGSQFLDCRYSVVIPW